MLLNCFFGWKPAPTPNPVINGDILLFKFIGGIVPFAGKPVNIPDGGLLFVKTDPKFGDGPPDCVPVLFNNIFNCPLADNVCVNWFNAALFSFTLEKFGVPWLLPCKRNVSIPGDGLLN